MGKLRVGDFVTCHPGGLSGEVDYIEGDFATVKFWVPRMTRVVPVDDLERWSTFRVFKRQFIVRPLEHLTITVGGALVVLIYFFFDE